VLLNRVGNAVKFTSAGSFILRTELTHDKEGTAVSFRVRDTGPGLAADVMERVFEPFYQSPEHRLRTGRGVGLGLALSRRLVERMGGRIGVRSEPGYGSEFWVRVPLDLGNQNQPPSRWQPVMGLRIGLVVTHPARRDIIKWQLAQWGAEVIEEMSQRLRMDAMLADWLSVEAAGGGEAVVQKWRGVTGRLGLIVPLEAASRLGELRRVAGLEIFTEPLRWSQVLEWLGGGSSSSSRFRELELPTPVAATATRRPLILLADDNAVNRRVVSALLAKLGCEVDTASDGVEALEKLIAAEPDLVLLDLEMPRMNGLQVARRLRRGQVVGCRASLPLVALSAHVLPEEVQKAFDAGMDGFLPKLVSLEQLRQALETHLDRREPRPAARRGLRMEEG
jgi:CheY-like chemotaxis protein